jgi:putative transposase
MPRGKRFPLEVMLRAMREVDNGVPVSVVCRKVGMVEKTFYRYREKYQGMEPTEARRLRELEEENSKLKKLLSEQMLHNEALRDVLSKNGEAREQWEGRGPCTGGLWTEPAQRVPGARRLAGHAAVPIPQAARHNCAAYSQPSSRWNREGGHVLQSVTYEGGCSRRLVSKPSKSVTPKRYVNVALAFCASATREAQVAPFRLLASIASLVSRSATRCLPHRRKLGSHPRAGV